MVPASSYCSKTPSLLQQIPVSLHFPEQFLQRSLQTIGKKEIKLESDILSSVDFLLCSNEAIDAPLCNKETFPSGSPVAVHTNEESPSAWFAFAECASSSRPRRRLLSLRLSSHVYAFVPHYTGAASADPHLAFKFPDQPASHALTAGAAPAEFFAALIQARLHA